MSIPDYQSIMLPFLKYMGDKQEHAVRDTIETLASEFNVTDAEQRELLPSRRAPLFRNRVGWAQTYLKKAGLVKLPRRGFCQITPRGLEVLQENPPEINVNFLKRYSEFVEFRTRRPKEEGDSPEVEGDGTSTPEESIEISYRIIRDDLVSELLTRTKDCSPSFFERLVVDLLVKMGYGGTRRDAGEAVGRSGDGGIDGIIKEDRLGLEIIYIQAKRWENTVGRPEIQKFVGALQGQRARKGVFITTSDFTKEAVNYVSQVETKVILIDGEQLAQLMIDHHLGVSTVSSYEIKKADSDYFAEED